MFRSLLALLVACGPAATDGPASPQDSGTPPPADFWSIDDDVRTPLYGSLNCQLAGEGRLYLNGVETNQVGTLQLQLGDVPTEGGTYTLADGGLPGPDEAYLSVGLDREQDNQYVASGGVVEVTVVDSPRAVEVSFDDVPSATAAGATAALSGRVGAREGSFVGACDFDDL